jgi:protein-tyrosine phosphatase
VLLCKKSIKITRKLAKLFETHCVMEEHNFDHLLNFRDVGSTINSYTNRKSLQPGIFYRSARPDETSTADRAHLTQILGIKTIIDLRSKTEHINASKKHAPLDAPPSSGAAIIPQTNEYISSSLQVPGINHIQINLNGGAFERALLWQLKYTSLARLLFLMACGYREDAIGILGREVMQQRGLIGLGIDTLEYSASEIKDILNVLSDRSNYPVLVHCTQGKDRTGLIVLIVLMLCGVDHDAISHDYMSSAARLWPEKEERLKEILRIGLSEDFAGCPDDFVKEVTRYTQDKYGGMEKYLSAIGVDDKVPNRVRRVIMQDGAAGLVK